MLLAYNLTGILQIHKCSVKSGPANLSKTLGDRDDKEEKKSQR